MSSIQSWTDLLIYLGIVTLTMLFGWLALRKRKRERP